MGLIGGHSVNPGPPSNVAYPHARAQSSDADLTKQLVKHGTDPKIATDHGDTALTAAAGIGWVEGVTYERSANYQARNPDMVLAAGVRLGSYEIRGLIGSGGMGEVYRARDIRLDRDVALKTLSDTWAAEGDRLGRFEREARILASLNHPNVAALYELFEAEGRRVLVMELVEGPTLADRVRSSRLSVDETLSVFLEIADGLEAAHERGIVHRDLKPANIKTPQHGRAKILDFGIAKTLPNAYAGAVDGALTGVSTTLGLTADIKILGTPAYMSPEQARGHSVDRRTDIWAYGCCLYEALSGGPAFSADTVSDTLARVLKDEPDWSALPDPLPQTVRILLARCLRKDPRKRLRDIGDARIELEDLKSGASWTGTDGIPRD